MVDLEKLFQEHPTHPHQIWLGLQHEAKAKRYWEARRNESPPPADCESMITLLHASQAYFVSIETVRRWIRVGGLRTEKVKGRRMVNQDDLENYIRCGKTTLHIVNRNEREAV